MRYLKVDLSEIKFEYHPYSQELYQSILRIGFSFPIQVRICEDHYECIDGAKRLSVLTDILKEDPNYKRGSKVYILIKNSEFARSNDCWRGRNTH